MYRRFVAAILFISMLLNTTAVTAFAKAELPIGQASEHASAVSASPSDADPELPPASEVPKKASPSTMGGTGFVDPGITPLRVNQSLTDLYRGVLPSSYDSRNYHSGIPAVRNQGQDGTCWAFSATSLAEFSSAVRKGTAADYSEGALAYFSYHRPTDPLGLTSGDYNSIINGETHASAGGNCYLAAFMYSGGLGPVSESKAPYESIKNGYNSSLAYDRDAYMTDARFFHKNDTALIKQAIMKSGAVGVSFYYSKNNDAPGGFYYCNTAIGCNHSVTIVGWNDYISVSSFKTAPPGNGAWLARNSWGSGFGSGGYFWISYNDQSLDYFCSMDFISSDEDWDNIYYYDGSGATTYYSVSRNTAFGNVFRAQNNEVLKAASVAFYSTGVPYSLQIYKKSSAMTSATDGTPMLSTPVTGTTDASGIYTVRLPKPVPLKKGEYYSVAFTVSADSTCVFTDYTHTSFDSKFRYVNHTESGQSFSGSTDLALYQRCFRIKALTDNAKNYGITYVLNGGTNSSSNPVSYSEIDTVTLKSPARKGYTFRGWYTDSSFTSRVTKIAAGSSGSRTFYAKWTPNTYTVKFNANGGKGTMSALTGRKFGTAYTLPANKFTRTDYAFTGWNTKADGSGSKIANKASIKSLTSKAGGTVTLYAQWKSSLTKYKITYVLNSGKNSSKNPSVYTKADTVTLRNPSRTGYTFAGWYSNKNFSGSSVTKIAKGSTGNRTLYAKWKANTYTVKFSANGGTGSMTALTGKKYGASFPLPACTFKRTGYAFTGWNTKANGAGTKIANKASVKNLTSAAGGTVTLYAQWKSNSTKYKITYVLNGGKNSSKNPSVYTALTAVTLANPSKTGYTFAGWYTNKNFTGSKVTKIAKGSTGSKTFYAKWKANTYTIRFNANGGTGSMASVSTAYGKSVTLKACTLKKSGKIFNGWNTKADGSGKAYADKAAVKNLTSVNGKTVTLYAQWVAKSGWVLRSKVPAGAKIVDRKWKYTKVETKTADAPVAGWTVLSSGWQKTANGVCTYASFPSGFDRTHSLYAAYSGGPVTAYNNGKTMRTVGSPYQSSYIYWHWTYNNGPLPNNNYNCLISDVQEWDRGKYYQYFTAFLDSYSYGHTDPLGNTVDSLHSVWRFNPAEGSWWWFRFPVYSMTYEDFKMVYWLEKRTAMESSKEVKASATAVDVKEYVRYTVK